MNDKRMVDVELLEEAIQTMHDLCTNARYASHMKTMGKKLRAIISGPGVEPVMLVVRNDAGQIRLVDSSGNAFDMSKHVGDSFYLAAPSAPVHAVPDWQWVPKKPTKEMAEAGAAIDPERASVWEAMLAAAPQPPKVCKTLDGMVLIPLPVTAQPPKEIVE